MKLEKYVRAQQRNLSFGLPFSLWGYVLVSRLSAYVLRTLFLGLIPWCLVLRSYFLELSTWNLVLGTYYLGSIK